MEQFPQYKDLLDYNRDQSLQISFHWFPSTVTAGMFNQMARKLTGSDIFHCEQIKELNFTDTEYLQLPLEPLGVVGARDRILKGI